MDYKYDFHIIKKGEYLQEDSRVSKAIEHFHYENEDVICITAFGNPSAIYTFNNAKKYLNKNDIANINVAGAMIVERLNADYMDIPTSYS